MEQYLKELIENIDAWLILGAVAQTCFFCRFLVQWLVSEKHKKSIVPVSFWYLSVMGSTGLLIYSLGRKDLVFIFGHLFNNIVYIRNLMLINKQNKMEK
ncbi:MAG: lipid-A-disaccharide synthase N-terminal domain-containing protein [Desulfobacterales bacterium]|nr:lipid-A-disaccharide synthase N-terminal domain-containing protein [Desulfobacterales bacterium]